MIVRVPLISVALVLATAFGCSKSADEEPALTKATTKATTKALTKTTTKALTPSDVPFTNARVFEGMLVGGQPTSDQLRKAASSGVKTVINLRGLEEAGVGEEAKLAAELKLEYISIPVAGPAGLTTDAATKLDQAIAAAGGPVLVHCGSGNRVGGLFAVRAHKLKGMPVEEAIALGKASGLTSLEPAVRKALAD